MANHPETPLYGPCLAITVDGSNWAHTASLPPYSRATVWSLVPALGPVSPAMSTKLLNSSGCITVRSPAHVPPIDQPTMPQSAAAELLPKCAFTYGTTSLVR